ncbi:MAG: hypothetical protein FJX77_18045 [Armatimonadetes bacterium]|nr:hypothetical protein [Armatimonadota bacterium]
MPAPPLAAKRLGELEGELWAYRQSEFREWAATLPAPGRALSRRLDGDIVLTITRERPVEHANVPDPPELRGNAVAGSTELLVLEVSQPEGEGSAIALHSAQDGLGSLALMDAGGESVEGRSRGIAGSGTTSVGGRRITRWRHSWGGLVTSAKSVRLSFRVQTEPYRALRFRFRNIPLPAASRAGEPRLGERQIGPGGGLGRPPAGGALNARPAPAARPPEPQPEPEHPFFDPKGGELAVLLPAGGDASGARRLLLGLAREQGQGWGPIRWVEIAVNPTGRARLRFVQPGRYQVHQRQLGQPGAPAAPGSGAEIIVRAGKIVELKAAAGSSSAPRPR